MKMNTEWKDYEVIKTSDGYKLERWADVLLLRPDPQVIWKDGEDLTAYKGLNAVYKRSASGGGEWSVLQNLPKSWTVSWRNLRFKIMPMGFKHTGLFPEQAVNWAAMIELIGGAKRKINVLNLFAYTGGATVACLSAGATVCHVDAAKGMVDRAKENVEINGLNSGNVRFIVDDCLKFVEREIRRGNRYDAIIMDPPSYGRGPTGEMWKIENHLYSLVELTKQVMSDAPLFYLINSYTTGLQPAVLSNVLSKVFCGKKGKADCYEVVLPTKEKGVVLPCGASGFYLF